MHIRAMAIEGAMQKKHTKKHKKTTTKNPPKKPKTTKNQQPKLTHLIR